MIRRVLVFLMAIISIVSVGFTQTIQTGAIRGTVTDPDGVALPGLTVILRSPALIVSQVTSLSNANGVYRFLSLAPGEYELTFVWRGMNTLVRKGIVVRVGKTATVDTAMTLKSIAENVIVIGKAPTVDRQKTTGVTSLDIQLLKLVPSVNRNFMDYFNLTPGVSNDSVHGSGDMENSYNLDGVNMGDPATGTNMVPFGMDIMEEIAVQSGGLSAEYGSVKGAVINVVTKSGGNKLNGSAFFYYDNEAFAATNTKGTDLYKEGVTPEKTGRKFQMEPGFTLGGPIIKDKLWFFANVNMIRADTYASGYPYDKKDNIPADTKMFLPYIKLTFQPTASDKFMVSYNYANLLANHRGASRYYTEATTRTQETPTHVFNAHWTKTWGANWYANLKLAYIAYNLNLDSKTDGSMYMDWLTARNYGTFWRNKDDSQRDRYQVVADATTFIDHFVGAHELKIGGELQMAKTSWWIENNPSDATGLAMLYMYPEAVGGNGIYYGIHVEGFDRKDNMVNFSLYLNDTWNMTHNVTFTLGVRYDYNSTIWPAQNQDEAPVYNPFLKKTIDRRITKSMTPMKWNNVSPRLGVIYDIFSDGTTLFKGSWSHYVEPNQIGWINIAHPNGWHYWLEYYFGKDTVSSYRSGETPAGTQVGYKNYNLIAPTCDELTVGFERELWQDWSVGLRYLKKWDRDLIHVVDAASVNMDTLMETGELVWKDWEVKTALDTHSGNTVTFYNNLNPSRKPARYIVNPPGAGRDYDGFELTLNKRFSQGWSVNVSYVYANSRGLIGTSRNSQALGTSLLFSDPNAHENANGRFELESRHQVKITGLLKGPLGINVGGYFKLKSGQRWTRMVSAEFLHLKLNQNTQQINAEPRGSSGYPAVVQLDLKVEKAFRVSDVELKLFADIFNLFNANTVTQEFLDSSNPKRKFKEDLLIMDPRVVRLGVRVEF